MTQQKAYRVLDLFSGIGGFALGLEWAGGFETVAFCDNEPSTHYWLRKRFPSVPIHSDVKELNGRDLIERYGRIDLITGGFPCQDISVAGKGKGAEEGERSSLVKQIVRVIRELREADGRGPTWLLLENSPQLKSRGYDWLHGELVDLGFTCWPSVVGARNAGATHRRERVWLICTNRVADSMRDGFDLNALLSAQLRGQREAVAGLQLPEAAGAGSGVRPVAYTELAGWQESLRRTNAIRTGAPVLATGPGDVGRTWDVEAKRLTELADASGFGVQGLRSLWESVAAIPSDEGLFGRNGDRIGIRTGVAPVGRYQHGWEPSRLVAKSLLESTVGERPDDVSDWLARNGNLFGINARTKNPLKKVMEAQLKALGNSIVPRLAMVCGVAIRALDLEIDALIDGQQSRGVCR